MDRVTLGPDELDAGAIRANLDRIREEVAGACRASGRKAQDTEILVATKYVSTEGLDVLRRAGVELIGENRAQDLKSKRERYGDAFIYDFIGHLQSNKVRQVLPLVRLIHSVESLSVVKEIEKRSASRADVLLEVNISEEASKCGIIPGEIDSFLEEAARYPKVNFTGLMTMPPLAADPESARPLFAALRHLASRLSRKWQGRYHFKNLSMGTSNDYKIAVEEGATVIRVGNILFERP